MRELETGGSQILDAMSRLQDLSSSVKNGSSEMITSADAVTHSINKVQSVSKGVQEGSREISAGMKIIRSSMDLVSDLGGQMHGISENLNQEIQKFRISSDDSVESPSPGKDDQDLPEFEEPEFLEAEPL